MTRAEYILDMIEKKGDDEGFFGKGKGKHQQFVKGSGYTGADKFTATNPAGKSRMVKKEGGGMALEKPRRFGKKKRNEVY